MSSQLYSLSAMYGYLVGYNGAAAVLYARDFELADTEIAVVFAWVSLGAMFALSLLWWMDAVGRVRVLRISLGGSIAAAAATAAAPELVSFVAFQIAAGGCALALLLAVGVILSEELAPQERARGQGRSGLWSQLGGGAGLVVGGGLAEFGLSWRWGWALAAAGGLVLWWAARSLPDTRERCEPGDRPNTHAHSLLDATYRIPTLAALASGLLATTAGFASGTWLLYFPQAHLGVPPHAATLIVVASGALGLLGFPAGARLCDRFGRRTTLLAGGVCMSIAESLYFWVPPGGAHGPIPALFATSFVTAFSTGLFFVARRSLLTEYFPTAARSRLLGLSSATTPIALLLAQTQTAVLAQALGGLVPAVTVLCLAAIPGTVFLYLVIPETRETARLSGVEGS